MHSAKTTLFIAAFYYRLKISQKLKTKLFFITSYSQKANLT